MIIIQITREMSVLKLKITETIMLTIKSMMGMASQLLCQLLQFILAGLAGEALKSIWSLMSTRALILQVHNSMDRIDSEFEIMDSFLSNFNSLGGNERSVTESWEKRVTEIAERCMVVIDEYEILIRSRRAVGFVGFVEMVVSRPFHVVMLQNIVNDLKNVEENLCHAFDMKERYDIGQRDIKRDMRTVMKLKVSDLETG